MKKEKEIESIVEEFLRQMHSCGAQAGLVLLSFPDSDSERTWGKYHGMGNYYEKLGMAQEYVNGAAAKAYAVRKKGNTL